MKEITAAEMHSYHESILAFRREAMRKEEAGEPLSIRERAFLEHLKALGRSAA